MKEVVGQFIEATVALGQQVKSYPKLYSDGRFFVLNGYLSDIAKNTRGVMNDSEKYDSLLKQFKRMADD